MYGIFAPHLVDFYGKCRELYHTWMQWATNCLLIFFRVEKLLFAPCGIRCEASTKFAFIACGATIAWRRGVVTRWAPTIYKWSYNNYNPYKWRYLTLLTTGRSTPCRFMRKR